MRKQWIYALLLMAPLTASAASSIDPDTEIAIATQTPLARNPETKYYSFPLVNDINYAYGQYNRTQDILYFKPIVSVAATCNYDLIVRTIAPILQHQPTTTAQPQYLTGIGDLNPTFFISPMYYRTTLWAVGPTLSIPTASNKAIGSGKWSIGPEVALFTMPKPWVFGLLTSNIWSIAGAAKRHPVDQFSFQYFISYNFSKGWYLTSEPTITADWKAAGNQVWTVPIGIGGGKSWHLNDNGINVSIQSYYNVIRPSQLGPNWQLQAKLEFTLADRKVHAI